MSSSTEFPGNIVASLKVDLANLTGEPVVGRPLRPNDANGAIGVTARLWTPQDWQIGQFDPALTRYTVQIESMARHANEEEAIATHNRLAKSLRVMLYRDAACRARLQGLSESSLGVNERVARYGVEDQRFTSNEVLGEYIYYSVLNLWVETEIV